MNIDTLEEEKKINSLKESHEWDGGAKDQLSLSSTSLPDVGIHEPELHVKGESLESSFLKKNVQLGRFFVCRRTSLSALQ